MKTVRSGVKNNIFTVNFWPDKLGSHIFLIKLYYKVVSSLVTFLKDQINVENGSQQ